MREYRFVVQEKLLDELPENDIIVRIQAFDLPCYRKKYIGKNAALDEHGDKIVERVVRICDSSGNSGLGCCRIEKDKLQKLIGKKLKHKDPITQQYQVNKVLGNQTMALWDLLGNIHKKPVYALLGEEKNRLVPVYDGSIYFFDLLSDYKAKWKDKLKDELDSGASQGHAAFKIKIGRGSRWMDPHEGYFRDLDVLREARNFLGEGVCIGVDANNGYGLELTKRFIQDADEINISFVEEMFPENVFDNRELIAFLKEKKSEILIADGESWCDISDCEPYVPSRLINILQGNIIRFGIEGVMEEANFGSHYGLSVAPHGWGTYLGFFASLHLGKVIYNYYMAEHDPLYCDVVCVDGYLVHDGLARISDKPGFGFIVDEEKLKNANLLYDLNL